MGRNRRLLYVLALGLVAVISAGGLQAGISISPGVINVELGKGRPAGEFVISNIGDAEERYRVQCTHFTFTVDGMLQRIPSDEHSLAGWTMFNPKEFTLPPKTRRIVRFVISPRGELRPGEYWGAMELESLNVSTRQGRDDKGHSMKLRIIPTILVPMFGRVGEITHQAVIQSLKVVSNAGKPQIQSLITNNGTGRLFLKGQYEISDPSGKIVDKGGIGASYVFAGTQRNFRFDLKTEIPAGQYVLRVQYDSSDLSQPLIGETKLDWNPAPADQPGAVQTPDK